MLGYIVIPKPGTKSSRWHCNIIVEKGGVITNLEVLLIEQIKKANYVSLENI